MREYKSDNEAMGELIYVAQSLNESIVFLSHYGSLSQPGVAKEKEIKLEREQTLDCLRAYYGRPPEGEPPAETEDESLSREPAKLTPPMVWHVDELAATVTFGYEGGHIEFHPMKSSTHVEIIEGFSDDGFRTFKPGQWFHISFVGVPPDCIEGIPIGTQGKLIYGYGDFSASYDAELRGFDFSKDAPSTVEFRGKKSEGEPPAETEVEPCVHCDAKQDVIDGVGKALKGIYTYLRNRSEMGKDSIVNVETRCRHAAREAGIDIEGE